MNIRILITTFFLLIVLDLSAQVTIGSGSEPEKAALLEIKSFNATTSGGPTTGLNGGGVLFSRVNLEEKNSLKPFLANGGTDDEKKKHTGLVVYNVRSVSAQSLKEGLYMWNGEQWVLIAGKEGREKFFYMPSLPINTSSIGWNPIPIDLHKVYKDQFLTPKVISQGAPAQIPVFENATDLYYYVTSYDETVFRQFVLLEDGKMYYEVINSATPWSFVNVVFVIK
ncbi:hypothetical protein [Parabacteroides sp. PF5-9]|uniref:hypothetical protein n=1 Tax=Parabacteroides sp. PF5-9 TaxID=1742404 RepID=UPI002473FBB2|nr:hypothetical protein [Parabacteroides sp. PF5-9]MDH6358136.1 hypothetical protein [Parabacteroides sp. PF5-9]